MLNQTVSHYQIIEKLGGGGMGVVYRAEDLKLRREVALKFLPEELTQDKAAVERFEREARLAAAINHPNICTVYEVEEFNGSPFLAMELLEGETLKNRLEGKPLPLNDLLDWAIQIATGLEAAHARGILHRDVKPANLFITNIGQVKILDFGLAKLRSQRKTAMAGGVDDTTITETDPGSTLGTPAYMSPEQAQADELDARTDLFSLGVVLYEMATGKLPFQGPSGAAIITSLLRDAPPPPIELNPKLPPELGRLITKALEKDPDARYQTAADLRSDLKRVKRDVDSHQLSAATIPSLQPMRAARQRHWMGWLIAAAAGVFIIALAAFLFTRPLPPPRVVSIAQITSNRLAKSGPFLSDGARLYFNTAPYLNPQPYQVPGGGGESVPVPVQLKNAWLLDLSPDGSELLVGSFGANPYAFNQLTLWTSPVLGGSPRRLNDLVVGDAAWSRDGQQLAFTKGGQLLIARSDGTQFRKILSVSGTAFFPRWSPDGSRIRFSVDPNESLQWNRDISQVVAGSRLWEASTDGSNSRPLLPGWPYSQCCGNWTSDGKYFLFEAVSNNKTSIWAISERKNRFLSASYEPVRITTGPMETYGPTPSPDGKRIFVGGRQPRIEILRYDIPSKTFVPYLAGRSAEGLDFSRDGKWIAYVSYPDGTLWRSMLDGGQRLQLTRPPLQASLPRWSPDGKQIAFMASQSARPPSIFVLQANGGAPQKLTQGENTGYDPTWSPDGSSIAFGGYPIKFGVSKVSIQLLNVATRQVSVLPGSEGLWSPRWSPDGRYIAALSGDAKALLLFDLSSRKWTELAKANLGYITWSRDSEYIYFDILGQDSAFARVRIRDRKVEQVVSLKNLSRKIGAFGPWTGLTPDDSLLVAHDASFDEIYALDWDAP